MLIANTYQGGKDLYYGVPDLQGAVVSNVTQKDNPSCYETWLELTRTNGSKFNIVVLQERE